MCCLVEDFRLGSTRPSDTPELTDYTPTPKPIKQGRDYSKKKQTNHNQRVREFWEKQGYWVERLEGLQNVNGAVVKKDYMGCFDFECTKPGVRVLVQVSSKSAVREHLRKMLGDTEYRTGRTRRSAVNHLLSLGVVLYVQWFDQPKGHGTTWETGLDPIDAVLIENIDAGRRTKRVKA